MRFEVSCEIAAPVERVWEWWTDYGAPGASMRVSHGLGSSLRTILSRDATTVVFEDRSLLGRVRRTVRLQADERSLAETGEGSQTFESTWRFESAGGGRTRITRAMRVRAAPVYAPLARWIARRDLRHHARACERELRGGPGGERTAEG